MELRRIELWGLLRRAFSWCVFTFQRDLKRGNRTRKIADFLKKEWSFPASFFFIFVFSKQICYIGYKINLPISGFEMRISCVGNDHSTNWATTAAKIAEIFEYCFYNFRPFHFQVVLFKYSNHFEFIIFTFVSTHLVCSPRQLQLHSSKFDLNNRVNNLSSWGVVVAQLVERSLSISEVRGSTPVIWKVLVYVTQIQFKVL